MTADKNMKFLRFKVFHRSKVGGFPMGPDHVARIEHELGVITQLGFASYFLVVANICDFMRATKTRFNVRGSGCGSTCVWRLGISHRWLDPILFKLPFERFLNPSRVTNPDLDIDIDDTRRQEVVDYTIRKYGADRVARIMTFGMLGPRAAIRDVARAMGMVDYQQVVAPITAMIPAAPGTRLRDEMAKTKELRQLADAHPELFRMAEAVEGKVRNPSIHAAGVVIAPTRIRDMVPVFFRGNPDKRDDAGRVPTTQWDMYDVEKRGLLKMDFLGQKPLRVIDETERVINGLRLRHGLPADFSVDTIPQDDPATWDLLHAGRMVGVFQLGRDFIHPMARRMNLRVNNSIVQLAVLVSIIRPGMMDCGATEQYLRRGEGAERAEPMHPLLEETLKDTHGLICIHEDAMVATPAGHTPLKEVKVGDVVMSCSLSDGRVRVRRCRGCRRTRVGEGVRVVLDNGISVVLTRDHKVRVWDAYKEAGHLTVDDLVATSPVLSCGDVAAGSLPGIDMGDIRFHGVRAVEPVDHAVFYGIAVEGEHNLFVNGMLVSNCFQEDIMSVSRDLAGFSMVQADELRLGVAKKKKALIDRIRPQFFKGAIAKGVGEADVSRIWDQMKTFALYGFNRSHATAYAMVAYWTAYLKANHTAIYMANLINSEAGVTVKGEGFNSKAAAYVQEAIHCGVKVLPPCVLRSRVWCSAVVSGRERPTMIRFGIGLIKQVSARAAKWVCDGIGRVSSFKEFVGRCFDRRPQSPSRHALAVAAWWNLKSPQAKQKVLGKIPPGAVGPFVVPELVDLLRGADSVDPKDVGKVAPFDALHDDLKEHLIRSRPVDVDVVTMVNRTEIKSLIQAGALDALQPDRFRALAMVGPLVDAYAKWHEQKAALDVNPSARLRVTPDQIMDVIERMEADDDAIVGSDEIKLVNERAMTGCFLSTNPFEVYRRWAPQYRTVNPKQVLRGSGDAFNIMAMLVDFKEIVVKTGRNKGSMMGMFTLLTEWSEERAVAFSEAWTKIKLRCGNLSRSRMYVAVVTDGRRGDGFILQDMIVLPC